MGHTLDIIFIARQKNRKIGLKVTTALLITLAAIFAFITLGTLALLFINTSQNMARMDLDKLEETNRQLSQRLDALKDHLGSYQSQFEDKIASDNRQRTFWEMNFIHPDIWSMGIGGIKYLSPSKHVTNHNNQSLNEIYKALDILHGKCSLRRKSLAEIDNQICSKYELWTHIPAINPIPGSMTGSGYGYRVDPFTGGVRMHYGVDIGASLGSPITASGDGVISYAGWNMGLGLDVEIDHGYGFISRYAHCNSILVAVGDSVKRGQVIAMVGQTGRAKSPHLHYEIFVSSQHVNPEEYINFSKSIFD
jgi:murein DD-endopeptidase MepM/ murein hydrolase activator NlpD